MTFDPELCFITILAVYMTISIGSIKIIQLIQLSRALEASQTLLVIGMGAEKKVFFSYLFIIKIHTTNSYEFDYIAINQVLID